MILREHTDPMKKNLQQIEKKIESIKQQLLSIGPMRSGSLTMQYHKPKEKKGPYWQISYTYKMKSRTEYVNPDFVPMLQEQIKEFKKFKLLMQEWIDLALDHSWLTIEIAKRQKY